MFFFRFVLIKQTANEFTQNPTKFVSFQFASTWEEVWEQYLTPNQKSEDHHNNDRSSETGRMSTYIIGAYPTTRC